MVATMELASPPAPETQDASPPSTNDDPQSLALPTEPDESGQNNNLPPEEETPPGADQQSPPDDSQPNADLTAALADLPKEQADALVAMAKTGELPRIAKLVAQLHQHDATIEEQQRKIEELEAAQSNPPATTSSGETALPEPVAKLKTLSEVKQTQRTAQKTLDYIENLFEEQPYNGDPESKQYTVGQQTFSRRELLAEKRAAQATLRSLPERAEQIQQQTRFEAERTQARAAFTEAFTWAKDPQSNQSKEIAACLKANPWMKTFVNPDWIAAQMLYGYKPLMQQLEARKSGNGNGKPANGTPRIVTPRVPLNQRGMKPAAPAEAVKSALESARTNGTRESFAALLDATGH